MCDTAGRAVGWAVLAALILLAGCSSTPIPPTYAQEELRAICIRDGGWWHPDALLGGYCESFRG